MITETDQLAEALDVASELWPDEQGERAALLRRLIAAGIETVENTVATAREERIRTIREAAGKLTGVWPTNWRDELLDEWPQ